MITDILRTAPRAVVTGYLRAARMPLTAAERIAKQQGNEAWPPALAFEAAQDTVETVAGSLLRDPDMIEDGRMRQAKVAKLRKADALKTEAELEKLRAREAEQQRKGEIAEQRKQTVQAAKERKDDVENQAAAQERHADTKAAQKKTAVRQQKAKQEKIVDRRERTGRAEALDSEAKALEIVKDALEAEEKTELIDATIEANKEARKTG